MTAVQDIDPVQASVVGGRTLEVFAETPQLNRWLYSKLSPHVHGDVLEIGSGIGNLSALIVESATRVVLSDMESHYLEALEKRFGGDDRVTVARYDLESAPSPEIARRRFDTIVAVNVIEHIRDDEGLVAALGGLLKPGGELVVYVPACPGAYGTLDGALGHHRRYTPATLTKLLSTAGLETEPPSYINLFGLLGWMLNGRVLRRERLSPWQLSVFERLVPLFRIEDRIRLPIGLGIYTAARKVSQEK
jgi:SAM-dependent methyltransferase